MRALPLLACVGLVILTLAMFRSTPASLPSGATPVETRYGFDWIRTGDEIDGMVEVLDGSGASLGTYYLDAGQLYQDPGRKQPTRLQLIRTRYLLDPRLDLGAWAGLASHATSSPERDERLQAGIRLSPLRLGYGIVALDLIASPRIGGAGFSVYPPTEYFGQSWRHLGLGAWYGAPFRGAGEPGWVFGLGFSTRD